MSYSLETSNAHWCQVMTPNRLYTWYHGLHFSLDVKYGYFIGCKLFGSDVKEIFLSNLGVKSKSRDARELKTNA